ncbi:hypothetical protein ONZ45_g12403 [Pleurotus djamor]|nr:hypothetical protein ONZ45_g12403 [Pleurotus djamor]
MAFVVRRSCTFTVARPSSSEPVIVRLENQPDADLPTKPAPLSGYATPSLSIKSGSPAVRDMAPQRVSPTPPNSASSARRSGPSDVPPQRDPRSIKPRNAADTTKFTANSRLCIANGWSSSRSQQPTQKQHIHLVIVSS